MEIDQLIRAQLKSAQPLQLLFIRLLNYSSDLVASIYIGGTFVKQFSRVRS